MRTKTNSGNWIAHQRLRWKEAKESMGSGGQKLKAAKEVQKWKAQKEASRWKPVKAEDTRRWRAAPKSLSRCTLDHMDSTNRRRRLHLASACSRHRL